MKPGCGDRCILYMTDEEVEDEMEAEYEAELDRDYAAWLAADGPEFFRIMQARTNSPGGEA